MSTGYVAIGWNRQKKIYDWLIACFCVLYLSVFILVTALFNPDFTFETVLIRSTSTLAVLLLHIILSIGPLCRINKKFLPLLYNRRHLGVTMFLIAAVHGLFSIFQFHALGNVNPFVSLFSSNTNYFSVSGFPFQALGFFALIILFLMAATSHDFWLHNLSPKTWKALHMFVYLAYALIVMHVMLGVIQYETHPLFVVFISVGAAWLIILHLIAGYREVKKDNLKLETTADGFVYVCNTNEFEEGRAKIFCIGKERIAVYKHGHKLYALHNVCKHQGGPLGEGKIIDGCITCPWHGYQYLPQNGQSPPPFEEKVSTYDLKLENGKVFLNPTPYPEGTERPGVPVPEDESKKNGNEFYIGWMAKAPALFAKHTKKVVLLVFPMALIAGALLSVSQKKFSKANFEFGKLTTLKGVYTSSPVPLLKVKDKNDQLVTIPLVGFGKFGAEAAMMAIEKEKGVSLDKKEITLRGTLLYGDGKILMQVDKNDNPDLAVGETTASSTEQKDLGTITIRGEIVDPKCYFGVMKPGEGKGHRDCAIRCILGGIPPVLHVQNEKGESNYYLIVGPNGEKMNETVQDIVADPVSITARAVQQDDWIILYTNKKDMRRIAYSQIKDPGAGVLACSVH